MSRQSMRTGTVTEVRESNRSRPEDRRWPWGLKFFVTLVLFWHLSATLAGALAGSANPAIIWRNLADVFRGYYGALDLGYGYRFYANPGPTPVVRATLEFEDGHEEVVRLPDHETRPRIRYQRELALANALHQDFLVSERYRQANPDVPPRRLVAESYARHLLDRPGCVKVTLEVIMHQVDIAQVFREITTPGGPSQVDLRRDDFYSEPVLVGVYERGFSLEQSRVEAPRGVRPGPGGPPIDLDASDNPFELPPMVPRDELLTPDAVPPGGRSPEGDRTPGAAPDPSGLEPPPGL